MIFKRMKRKTVLTKPIRSREYKNTFKILLKQSKEPKPILNVTGKST